jgi:catechol 2,3-dioxygenase
MNNLSEQTAAPTLPDDLRLGPVHIAVTDLDHSIAFYEESIGLQLHGRDGEVARLGAGAEDLLVLHEEPQAGRAGRHAGLYHFALLFPTRQELARAVRRLAEAGTPIQGASDHGISEAIYLPDPDGNGIELAADQPRANWGNLRDPTTIGPAPLDMAGLMATIEGEELSPKADRDLGVGHLHLHVSDIEQALAFYRDIVGFEVQTLFQGAAFVSAGGYHHHLGLNTWRGEGIPPQPGGTVGLHRWTVLIDHGSLGQLRERLESAGVEVTERDGGLDVLDPFGIPLRFATA